MKQLLCALLVLSAVPVFAGHHSTCSPTGTCKACKNCKYCKNCSKNGGTCSVCKKAKRTSVR